MGVLPKRGAKDYQYAKMSSRDELATRKDNFFLYGVSQNYFWKGVFVGSVDHGKFVIEIRSCHYVLKLIYENKLGIEVYKIGKLPQIYNTGFDYSRLAYNDLDTSKLSGDNKVDLPLMFYHGAKGNPLKHSPNHFMTEMF